MTQFQYISLITHYQSLSPVFRK